MRKTRRALRVMRTCTMVQNAPTLQSKMVFHRHLLRCVGGRVPNSPGTCPEQVLPVLRMCFNRLIDWAL